MDMVKQILRFAAPLPDPEKYERYLFVGPHPDDIEIGAGATAAKLAAMGKKVIFCIVTDGRFGDVNMTPGLDRARLASIRQKEALRSASMLGACEVRFLEFCDGGFYEVRALEKALADVIAEVRPDVIFAPDPLVKSECHVDHLQVGQGVRKMAYLAPYGGIMEGYESYPSPVKAVAFYMTGEPNVYVNTTGYLKKQLQSIFLAHTSQYPRDSKDSNSLQLYLKLRALQYGIRAKGATGEAFRFLDQLHMHCLPEAGK